MLSLRNTVHLLIGGDKQILFATEYNSSEGLVATVARERIGLGISLERDIQGNLLTDGGACQLKAGDLTHATEGSQAFDLATIKPLPLSSRVECYKITTGIYGPLPAGTVGMILGRSGLTSQGFIVHPGIIDEDFKKEIKIMAYV